MRLALCLAILLCASVGAFADPSGVAHLDSGKVYPEGLPFSEAVRVGNTLYMSGHIGIRPGSLDLVPGGMQAEARQTLENIRATLEAHGLTMRHVVKCTVMLDDIGEWDVFNTVYAEYFESPFPARSAFGTDGLALGARLEVECIAVFDE
jgi:reactive intermediate/imine deaminase